MDYEQIETAREGPFAVVTMACPERRNALSEAHLRELLHAFQTQAKGDARGVVLAARGPVFSAGHDFGDMHGRSLEQMRGLLAVCAEVMQTIQSLPQPVIAQVEGLATAAGCQLVVRRRRRERENRLRQCSAGRQIGDELLLRQA